jgi:hypothetical protein
LEYDHEIPSASISSLSSPLLSVPPWLFLLAASRY